MEFAPIELAETTQAEDDLPIWKLSVDGASNAQGSRACLILTSPEGIDIEYALRFGFHASNNEAEYEAVIVGLNLAHSLEVDQLEVYSDSQLVVRQIEDTYEAKSETMILYLPKSPRFTKEICVGSGQARPQSGEFPSRRLGKISHSLAGRSRQVNACRILGGTLYRPLMHGGRPGRIRAELDGPHLGLY